MEIVYHSIHYIDLIRSFLGDPAGVYARTTRHPSALHMEATRSSVILDYGDLIRASVTTNHGHDFGANHQWSYVKWEGTKSAVRTQIGVVLDYPRGKPDELEYCSVGEGEEREWISVEPEGNLYPDAFVGTMASLQCFLEGSADELPTSIEDAFHTMAVVEAAYESSAWGGVTPQYDQAASIACKPPGHRARPGAEAGSHGLGRPIQQSMIDGRKVFRTENCPRTRI